MHPTYSIMDRLWQRVLRPVLFRLDPETAHQLVLTLGAWWSHWLAAPSIAAIPTTRQCMGLSFPNPIGLAAGLDKDAIAVPLWQQLGFGCIEIGTVTAQPQPGNPRPRLWRLPRDQALINCMGFNNTGADAVARRVQQLRNRDVLRVPLGINIGKTKVVAVSDAVADYCASFTRLATLADYVTINVSSPNTPGLRNLQTASDIAQLFSALQRINQQLPQPRPLLLKLAPDLSVAQALSCARAALDSGGSGLIVTNTTTDFSQLRTATAGMSGGLSGRPLWSRSTELLAALRAALGADVVLIGVGGIFTPADVAAKLAAGAQLVQVYTGFIYHGPHCVRQLWRDH